MRALVVAVVVLGFGCSSEPSAQAQAKANQKWVFNEEHMGTWVSVFIWGDDETNALRGKKLVMDEFARLDQLMSNFHHDGVPDGEVIQINNAAGDHPIVVGDETYAVIERAIFKGLWNFDEGMNDTLPSDADVKKRLAVIGYKDIVMDPKAHTVFLRKKGMAITLGGIAKGYAVDKASKLLLDAGFKSFMVQGGGDMYVAGDKDGAPWSVGIRDPRGPRDSMFALAPIKDHSFSTSGDYERGFVKNGRRYHHILDPRTGYPATASRSVTIRATDAFTADAWSKVMFIDGWKEGMEVIKREKLTDFEVVWVDDRNEVHMTPGLQGVVQKLKEPTPGV
jgi:thiamine biosynthesis lipoprotein